MNLFRTPDSVVDAVKAVLDEKKMDPVDPKELKGTHAQRKDKDIDNDGDADKSDEYLHKRRQAISKSMKEEVEELDEISQKLAIKAYAKRSGTMSHNDPVARKKEDSAYERIGKRWGQKGQQKADAAADKYQAEEVEQIDERLKVTHEDPLVTVHDKDGLHTHANLSVANRIFQTKVKHTDVHKGPVKTKSGGSYGDVKFALSQHHAQAVKDDAMKESVEPTEEGYTNPGLEKLAAKKKQEKQTAAEAADLDAGNVDKALKHDCAKHVVHEQYGEGTCISGQHTLLQITEDYAIVTHYDVMFEGEEGPFIVENIEVADLQITVSESHGHAAKKKMAEDVDLEEGRGRPRKNPNDPKWQKKSAGDDEEHDYGGQDSGKEPDEHFHVQLKKAQDSTARPYEAKFDGGKKHPIPHHQAALVVKHLEKLKPNDRDKVVSHMSKSPAHFKQVHDHLAKMK